MNMDDMILVSIDDHMIEPPHMYENHVPAKWRDEAPKVVHEDGIDQWVFQGEKTSTSFGMSATVGWPSEEWGFNPGTYSELRPGCFDVHERVRDMDANGVLGSMCFPTMAGWNARTFAEARDKEIALVMLQAYNDWAIDEWCGTYPGRFIPLGIVPMWDVEAAVAEVRRLAKKGCRSISFLETPHVQGFPSFLSGYWDPMLGALSDEGMVLSASTSAPGSRSSGVPRRLRSTTSWCWPARSAPSPRKTSCSGRRCGASPTSRWRSRRAGSAGSPSTSTGSTGTSTTRSGCTATSAGSSPPRCSATTSWPATSPTRRACCCATASASTSSPGSATTPTPTRRGPGRPSSPGSEFQDAGVTDETEINKITWENACRFYNWDPFVHTPKEQATVGALRARARDVDVTRMSRHEWRTRNEAAGVGAL